MEHVEELGKNRCPCAECKEFRSRRARQGARVTNDNLAVDHRRNGRKGADALLNRFREEVRSEAARFGRELSPNQLEARAERRRNNHLSRIASERHRNEKAS